MCEAYLRLLVAPSAYSFVGVQSRNPEVLGSGSGVRRISTFPKPRNSETHLEAYLANLKPIGSKSQSSLNLETRLTNPGGLKS